MCSEIFSLQAATLVKFMQEDGKSPAGNVKAEEMNGNDDKADEPDENIEKRIKRTQIWKIGKTRQNDETAEKPDETEG